MAEEKEDPGEEAIEQETVVPLPERDAMSIIGGPQPLPVVDDVTPTLDPVDPAIQPSPRYDV